MTPPNTTTSNNTANNAQHQHPPPPAPNQPLTSTTPPPPPPPPPHPSLYPAEARQKPGQGDEPTHLPKEAFPPHPPPPLPPPPAHQSEHSQPPTTSYSVENSIPNSRLLPLSSPPADAAKSRKSHSGRLQLRPPLPLPRAAPTPTTPPPQSARTKMPQRMRQRRAYLRASPIPTPSRSKAPLQGDPTPPPHSTVRRRGLIHLIRRRCRCARHSRRPLYYPEKFPRNILISPGGPRTPRTRRSGGKDPTGTSRRCRELR